MIFCTASSSGPVAAAAGVCRDVWVGTACEHSNEVTQPRLPLEVAPGAETTCPSL